MEDEQEPPSPTALTVSALIFYGFLSLISLWIMSLQELDVTRVVFGDGEHLYRDTLVGVGAGLGVVLLTRVSLRFQVVRTLNAKLRAILGTPGTTAITLLAVSSSVGEELLFRGALQPLIGLAPTAVIFGLLHGGFDKQLRLWAVFATLAGVLLGALTAWTGNLLAAILCHFTVNYFNLHTVTRHDGDEGEWT